LKALRKQLDRRLEYQSVILSVDRVEKRLLSEIENKMGQTTIKEHLTDFKEEIIDFLIKSQLKETTASVVHKILSYSAYLLVGLLALRMVNIPLTAFSFLGYAVIPKGVGPS